MKAHIKKYGGSMSFQSFITIALLGYVGCVPLVAIGQPAELSAIAGLAGLLWNGMQKRNYFVSRKNL